MHSVAIIHTQCGPYHLARAHALAKVFPGAVDLIQLAARERQRQWVIESTPFQVSTIAKSELESFPKQQLIDGLIQHLEQTAPSVLVVAGYSQPAMRAAIKWAKQQGIPVILLSDSQICDRPRNTLLERLKGRWIRNNCDAAFVAGASAAQYLDYLGFPRHKIWRGYDVVDNHHFMQASAVVANSSEVKHKNLGLPDSYFLYVGRFSPEKNLLRLIEAFSLYQETNENRFASLVMVGSGGQENELKKKVDQLGVRNVLWFGFTQIDELPIFYSLASALILPSVSEPWGLVINEAMACGLPILASYQCGAVLDLVFPGVNGYIFDPWNPQSICQAIENFCLLKFEKQIAMGHASQQIIQNFTPQSWATTLTDCILQTCRNS